MEVLTADNWNEVWAVYRSTLLRIEGRRYTMRETQAKTLLVKVPKPELWFGVEYNMNVYRGCTHGCIYCDSRSECYRIDEFENVQAKTNAPEVLRRELSRKRSKALIGTGSMSDPYIQAERSRRLTRAVLEVLADKQYPVHITTKSDLITRDEDVLEAIAASAGYASAAFTVTTCDNSLASWLEPLAPPPQARLKAMESLAARGVYTGVLLTPILPFILDNPSNVMTVVKAAESHGARFVITYMGVTLRDRQRDHYYAGLERKAQGLPERYRRAYGERYSCMSPRARVLMEQLREYVDRAGLVCRMEDIPGFQHLKPFEPQQLELF